MSNHDNAKANTANVTREQAAAYAEARIEEWMRNFAEAIRLAFTEFSDDDALSRFEALRESFWSRL